MTTLKHILLVTSLFFAINIVMPQMTAKVHAQTTVVVSLDSSKIESSCDDSARVKVSITNYGSSIATNDSITIQLDPRVYCSSVSSPYVNIGDSSVPVFFILSIPVGTTDTFDIYIRGYCASIHDSVRHDMVYVSYDTSSYYSYFFPRTYISQSPQLVFLNDSSLNMSVSSNYGDIITRMLFIQNLGTAILRKGELIFTDNNTGAAQIDSIVVVCDTLIRRSSLNYIEIDTIPPLMSGDSIKIYEFLKVTGCLITNPDTANYTIAYGCYNSLCDTLKTTGYIYPSYQYPYVSMRLESPDIPDTATGCEGYTKNWKVAIYNTGPVVPRDFYILLWHENYNSYSFIDTNSISYYSYPLSSIHIIKDSLVPLDTPSTIYSLPCFSAVNYRALSQGYFWIDSLPLTDTLYLEFSTHRCCASDTSFYSVNHYGYMYENWDLGFYWKDTCAGLMSSSGSIKGTNGLYLFQDFQPSRIDMAGFTDNQENADSVWLQIENTDYSNAMPDEYFSTFTSASWLEVKFMMDKGLRINDSIFFSDLSDTHFWYPFMVNYDSTTIHTWGFNDSVTAYFHLNQFANPDSLYNFIIESNINFELYSYCPAAEPHARYRIETELVMDSACSYCVIPLSEENGIMQILCPGCTTPGFEALDYSVLRTSIGLRDTFNRGLPDSPAVAANTNLISLDRAIAGDTVVGNFLADLYGGGAVTLSMLLDSFPLNYCYLYTTINSFNPFGILHVRVEIVSSSITIFDDTTGLLNIVSQMGNNYLYNLSLGTLQSYGLDTSYHYHAGDYIRVITTYRVDQNLSIGSPGWEESIITNKMYLTGIPDTLRSGFDTYYGDAGTIYQNDSTIDSLHAKDWYWCVAASGLMYFYDDTITNNSAFYNNLYYYHNSQREDYCRKVIICNYTNYLGYDPTPNVFPYEYRQPVVPDSFIVLIPPGYTLDSANSELSLPLHYGILDSSATYYRYGITTSHFNLDSAVYVFHNLYKTMYSTPIVYNSNYIQDTMPIPDEQYSYTLYVFISPVCQETQDTTHVFNYEAGIILKQPKRELYLHDTIPSRNRIYPTQILYMPNSSLELYHTTNLQQVSTREVCWHFNISNITPDSLYESPTYLWAYDSCTSGHLTLDTIYSLNTSYPHVVYNPITHIIQLDSIIGQGYIDSFSICCRYTCESPNAFDSIIFYYGWNCFGYPESIRQPNLCNIDSTYFVMQQVGAGFQCITYEPDSATSCDTIKYKILILSTDLGTIYDFGIDMHLPSDLLFLPGSDSLEFSSHTMYHVGNPTPDSLYFYLDSATSLLHTIGLSSDDTMIFYFSLLPSCTYSGDSISVTVSGISFCGEALSLTPPFSSIFITSCPALSANATALQNDSCYGEHIGKATVVASGGLGIYNYQWNSSPVQTTTTATGLYAGTYIISVTEAGYCYVADTVVITEPSKLSCTPIITEGCTTGTSSIVLSTIGGTPYYMYLYLTSSSTNDTIPNLTAGYYNAIVVDANGCRDSLDSMYVHGPPHLYMGSYDDTCNIPPIHTGEVTVIVVGGTPQYTYSWSPVSSSTATVTGLMAGSYSVTVTDSANCSATATQKVRPGSPYCPQPSGDSILNADTIFTNLELSGVGRTYIVTGTIVVAPGGFLSVDGSDATHACILKFAPDAMIVVERGIGPLNGGFLTLKGAKLTGWDDCSWGGIDIQGYDTSGQELSPYRYQGWLFYSQSMIENARSAIYVGKRDASVADQHLYTGGIVQGDYNGGGGTHSFFHNNTMSITFPAPYSHPSPSASYIEWSNFYSDSHLPDPCYSRPLWFISIDSTQEVTIKNDSFAIYIDTAGIDYNVLDSTYGIKDSNSRFGATSLNNCTFMNVNKAIDLACTISPSTVQSIDHNKILYSQTGIRITNGLSEIIRFDTLMYAPYYTVDSAFGIITNNTQNIYIRDNKIDSLNNGYGCGITVNNSQGAFPSRIWSNTVSNCGGYGIGTGGDNSALTVYCNTLENNGYGWYSNSLLIPAQGDCGGGHPPGNYFGIISDANANTSGDIVFPPGPPFIYNMEPGYVPHFTPLGTSNVSLPNCPGNLFDSNGYCGTAEILKIAHLNNKNDSSYTTIPWFGSIYPNPFSDFTNVPYFLPIDCKDAEIELYDVVGNKIETYSLTAKGVQSILKISSKYYSGGFYFCTMIVDGRNAGWKKLLIIK